MAFGTLDEQDDDAVMNEINMTPLVDVMLVLLIVFIITAPVMHHAFQLNLPQESSQQQDIKPDTIQVAVHADGSYQLDEEKVSVEELAARLAVAAQLDPQPELHISADKDARYEFVVHVMGIAQQASLTKIGFVTNPAP